MKYDILLWGAGGRAKHFIEKGYLNTCHIMGIVDSHKKQDDFMGYRLYMPKELEDLINMVDYIIIANPFFEEIFKQCRELGICNDKLLITDYISEEIFYEKMKLIKEISQDLFDWMEKQQMKIVRTNESDFRDAERLVGKGRFSAAAYTEDYFRYRTFEFAAMEIIKNGIHGAVAELGVFKGAFSSLINEWFKDTRFYLFDTFEGFVEEEAQNEKNMGRCDQNFISAHKDTSVEKVWKNLPYPKKCIICKGMFPDSITAEASKEVYSFVSIDVDFEVSTYEGIKFFYPRLSEGGMIFLHDYNTFYLQGIKLAVARFETENKIKLKKIPLADRAGTLVIIK